VRGVSAHADVVLVSRIFELALEGSKIRYDDLYQRNTRPDICQWFEVSLFRRFISEFSSGRQGAVLLFKLGALS
jgi:hypothetical protein